MDEGTPRLLLEGRPGIGKTTVARRLLQLLREAGVPVGGFTTGELRTSGRREGFVVEAVSRAREVLAHVGLPGPPRVGRYGLDLAAFERVALSAWVTPGSAGWWSWRSWARRSSPRPPSVRRDGAARTGRGRGGHRPARPPSVHRCPQASARHPSGSGHRRHP